MIDELVVKVVSGLVVAGVVALTGVPTRVYMRCSSFISRLRLRRHMAAGPFNNEDLEGALRFYVRPKFSNLDPSSEAEPGYALINARDDLFEMMDRFLDQNEQKYMLLFADSGMGKTSFLLNYLAYNYRIFRFRRHAILLVALGQPSPEQYIDAVKSSERKDTNLYLDALDEDPKAIGRVDARIQELLALTSGFRAVVITCRTQFFDSDQHIPESTGVARIGPVPLNQSKKYSFIRAYLSPFDEGQVRDYVSRRFPGVWNLGRRRKARAVVMRIPSLSVRPMLLSYLPDILDGAAIMASTVDIYEAMIRSWAIREDGWIKKDDLLRLSEALAKDFYVNRTARGGEFASPEEIERAASAIGVSIPRHVLTSRSLLNRTADGRFKFSHRSIMEYFVVRAALRAGPGSSIPFTDQMASFLLQRLGCASPSVERFMSTTKAKLSIVEPAMRLGHITNFNLYREIRVVDFAKSLQLSAKGVHGHGLHGTLETLILDMATSGLNVKASQLKEVRVVFEIQPGVSAIQLYITLFVNSYCVMAQGSTPRRSFARALDLGESQVQGFALCGTPICEDSDLASMRWSLQSKVLTTGVDVSIDLATLHNDHATGFAYDVGENTLDMVLIRLDSEQGSQMASFGILDDVKLLSVHERAYVLLSVQHAPTWRGYQQSERLRSLGASSEPLGDMP